MTRTESTLEWQVARDGGKAERDVVVDVRDLRVEYDTPRGAFMAVKGINFKVYRGETLGLVGESGSGKSTTALGILRLMPGGGRVASGQVTIDGVDMLALNQRELRQMRWKQVALIPQGAMNSLNPVMRIKEQIADAIETHEGKQPSGALKARILELFEHVGLPPRVYDLYPHELSGGMKQRVCIAMAIALNPPLVIADEPTSALDVVVQRLVAQTLLDIKRRLGVSMILIGHDMALQAQLVDRIAVMYKGAIVEIAPVESVFAEPRHPYTRLLIAAVPSIKERRSIHAVEAIAEELVQGLAKPSGLLFQYRCPHTRAEAEVMPPILQEVEPDHYVACHFFEAEDERFKAYVHASAGSA